jgi:hypothetical protein
MKFYQIDRKEWKGNISSAEKNLRAKVFQVKERISSCLGSKGIRR